MTRRAIRFLDQRLGGSPMMKKALEYVFPDHWSFMLGEIALYAFIVLVATGIYLTFFYVPSSAMAPYTGTFAPLKGQITSDAYRSVVDISLSVPAGLLIRQTHHWAADVFTMSIVLHLFRIFFTGAFRKPRDVNYWIGVTLLMLALLEGFLGYSLVDDLMSGMGLAIAYGVFMSVPLIGANVTFLFFQGQFPGGPQFFPRMYMFHILVIPVIIGALISIHLAIIMRQHHSQFPGPGRTERNVVGTPMWPAYALRSVGLMLIVAGALFLLGGLFQINPIWEWGPYHTYLSTNGAQPDWYLGWLIGALRLVPGFDVHIGSATLVPNPFWGGMAFPLAVFAFLYGWPVIERRITGDYRRHDLLERPRDNPLRAAAGTWVLAWVAIIFFNGADDRVYFRLNIPYEGQVWFWRVGAIVVPTILALIVYRVCRELRESRVHPMRGWSGTILRRSDGGGYVPAEPAEGNPSKIPAEEDERYGSRGSTLP